MVVIVKSGWDARRDMLTDETQYSRESTLYECTRSMLQSHRRLSCILIVERKLMYISEMNT